MDDSCEQQDFLEELNWDVRTMLKRKRPAEVTETTSVPRLDDDALTYNTPDRDTPNKAKRIETCVMYVDIRDSSRLSVWARPQRLARVYSAFVYAMIACARQAGGHVRNIIGDRVMVVFDEHECFERAFEAARLCNTAAQRMMSPRIKSFDFRCGVGVDYGLMMVVKAGVPRRGSEAEFYRSLVWLGEPANVASKLTDMAGKRLSQVDPQTVGGTAPTEADAAYAPVLVTAAVLSGLRVELGDDHPACAGWARQGIRVAGFDGKVYGADPLLAV